MEGVNDVEMACSTHFGSTPQCRACPGAYVALMLALTVVIAFLPGVVLFLSNLLGY